MRDSRTDTAIVEINLEEMISEQKGVDLSVSGAVIAAGLEAGNDSISVSHQNLNTGTALQPTVISPGDPAVWGGDS